MKTRLRILNEGDIAGHRTAIQLVSTDGDGNEVVEDITLQLHNTRVSVDLKVGEISRVTLECLCVGTVIDGVLDDLMIRHVGRNRFGQLWWRAKKAFWGVHRHDALDVTAAGAKGRMLA